MVPRPTQKPVEITAKMSDYQRVPSEDERRFGYLVVSDLHIQEAEHSPTGRLFYFDEEFSDFLQYYLDGRPRRLIINGDFVEFYHIPVRPDPADPLLAGVTLYPTDFKFFPGTEWQKSVWKLDVALKGHPRLLRTLARFLAAGNEIHMIRGNHDLEFCWPQVQEHFRRRIAQHPPEGLTAEEMEAITRSRITFHPWFYYEPGLLYVEHGHQYDGYCSNAHNLHPVLPGNDRRMELPISALSMRYFGSRITIVDPIAMENVNSIPRYIWRLIRTNPRQVIRMPFYYLEMAYRILSKITRPAEALDAAVASAAAERRDEIVKRFGLDAETLGRIEGLAERPIIRDLMTSLRCTLIDLVAVGLLGIVVGVVGWALGVAGPGGWVGAGIVILVLLLLLAGKHRMSKINDHRNLRDIARRIREIIGVRYVVFGHSHDPDLMPFAPSGNGAYFNVGTWMPRQGIGQFIYFELHVEAGSPTARLMRWDREKPADVGTAIAERAHSLREAALDAMTGRGTA